MRVYELVLIFDPELGEEKTKEALTSVEKLITSLKGKLKKTTDWGNRQFAYPIKKQPEGRYFLLDLTLPSESLAKLSPKIKLEPDIVRFLIVSRKIRGG